MMLLMSVGNPSAGKIAAGVAASGGLAIQLLTVRPAMARRTNAIRDGAEYAGRSRIHLVYVAVECVKALALIVVVTLVAAGVQ